MKKLLNMLALATLSTSAIPTVNMVLNSSVVKNLSLKDNLKSVNDNPFISQMSGKSGKIMSLAVDNQGNIYAGSEDENIYKLDLLDNLITSKQPDYSGPRYNGFVYNKEQTIDLKEKYLKSANLNPPTHKYTLCGN